MKVDGVVVGGGGVWGVEGVDVGKTQVVGFGNGEKKKLGKEEKFRVALKNRDGKPVKGGKDRIEVVIVNAEGGREEVVIEGGVGVGELVGKWVPSVEGECVVTVYVEGEQVWETPNTVLVVLPTVPLAPIPVSQKGGVVDGVGKEGKVKKGYLNKQGGVRKNWKKRYFEVIDGNLSYFEEKVSCSVFPSCFFSVSLSPPSFLFFLP